MNYQVEEHISVTWYDALKKIAFRNILLQDMHRTLQKYYFSLRNLSLSFKLNIACVIYKQQK